MRKQPAGSALCTAWDGCESFVMQRLHVSYEVFVSL